MNYELRTKKWSGRADLNGRSGRLTLSAAWQKSLLIRRDATLLLARSRSAFILNTPNPELKTNYEIGRGEPI